MVIRDHLVGPNRFEFGACADATELCPRFASHSFPLINTLKYTRGTRLDIVSHRHAIPKRLLFPNTISPRRAGTRQAPRGKHYLETRLERDEAKLLNTEDPRLDRIELLRRRR